MKKAIYGNTDNGTHVQFTTVHAIIAKPVDLLSP